MSGRPPTPLELSAARDTADTDETDSPRVATVTRRPGFFSPLPSILHDPAVRLRKRARHELQRRRQFNIGGSTREQSAQAARDKKRAAMLAERRRRGNAAMKRYLEQHSMHSLKPS